MPAWYCRWRRRAVLVLACLLLAVAAAPVAGVEGASSRPLAALVLRASWAQRAAASQASSIQARTAKAPLRETRAVVGTADVAARLRRVPPASRPPADERYLYLWHGKLLC